MAQNERYSRHLLLKEVGHAGQKALNNAKVIVVGAGGLGCPVLQYLAAAGVGTIGIVDGDVVSLSNLQRQILYSENEVGLPKVQMAAKRLHELNTTIEIIEHYHYLNTDNILEVFSDYDFVIDGTDNFSTRYMVNDACVILNKSLVFGSISKFEGQLSVFNYHGGPSYRCLFPEAPASGGNCSTEGVLGILPGIIGTQMASEAIKLILGSGQLLSGKLKVINVLNNTELYVNVKRVEANFERKQLEESYDYTCDDHRIKEISREELESMRNSEKVQIVDVREVYEFEEKHIAGSLNIPLSELEARRNEIHFDNKVVMVCASGVRSVKAIVELDDYNLYSLKGGVNEQG